jgi:hypothetical protein
VHFSSNCYLSDVSLTSLRRSCDPLGITCYLSRRIYAHFCYLVDPCSSLLSPNAITALSFLSCFLLYKIAPAFHILVSSNQPILLFSYINTLVFTPRSLPQCAVHLATQPPHRMDIELVDLEGRSSEKLAASK